MSRAGDVGGSDRFDRFCGAETPGLLATALALTGDVDAARDLVQEALLRTFRRWDTVQDMDRPALKEENDAIR